jgi:eukaryotic-like serine/threonine-protein kinase
MTTNEAPKQSPQDELIGRVINDRFRIISVIARGGMGRVYRAEQVPLGRLVAVKTLDPRSQGGDADPQFQQRFFLEASVASKLQHPNTVTVFDYGRTADGVYFIAMELVEGRSLYHVIREDGPISAGRVIHVAMQIARSLREAHRLDVIHRDLKPGNVLLTRHGDEEDFVKVLDFGLVKHVETESEQELTKAGLFMGSPKYMSPEQIRGERVDARSDIYSLGVVMYEMLAGKVPFDRENTVKVLMAHMHEAVPPLVNADCPPALAELVMRCLSKRPEGRPSSMDEVILMLKQATGMALTMSGAFALSQELRLSGSPPSHAGRASLGTPAHPFGPAQASRPPSLPAHSGELPHGYAPRSAPPAQPYMGSQPPPATGSWLPRAVVVLALLVAAGFLVLRFAERPARQDSEVVGSTDGTTSTPAPGSRASSNDAPIPTVTQQQHHVVVTVTSTPPGARISVEGRTYGETPADIEWWGEPAAPGREVRFVLHKEGFERVSVVRTIAGERLSVEAQLVRLVQPKRRSPDAPKPQPGTPQGPVVVPDDFKDDPY